ncbi:MAG: LPS export ABC transporter permease LptG [Marivivens sp.]|nr:LPS export ABC transporter permease LptG [Marivivens sp.]
MTLHFYLAKRFTLSFLGVWLAFFAVNGLLDIVEQLRRFGGSDGGLSEMLLLSALNVPRAMYQLLPLVLILSTILCFLSLSRNSELVVIRASGRSAIRMLLSPVLVTLIISGIAVAAFNPIVAATSRAYESRTSALDDSASTLALSEDGLWLRQGGDAQTVIWAQSSNLDGTLLGDVTFIQSKTEIGIAERVEAKRAELIEGAWTLTDVKIWQLGSAENPEKAAQTLSEHQIASNLTADEIRDSFGDPSSISIWELPAFIENLKQAGFAAKRHLVWLHAELSQPVLFLTMLLLGAAFSMRYQRGGGTTIRVMTAILLGFGLYFIRNFSMLLGESGQLPAALSAWAPPLAGLTMSFAILLQLEDG